MVILIMTVGFYQFSPAFGKKQDNIQKVSTVLKKLDFDLIVLPEFFATGYQFVTQTEVENLAEPVPEGFTTQALTEIAKSRNGYIVAGLPEKKDNLFYNSAVIVGPEGFLGVYRKSHLFFEEKLFFVPGDTGFKVWETEIGRIGIMICFDWFFPESARTLALQGAEIIAHPANLVLPYCPNAMPVRCLENRVFAITANRTGTESRKDNGEILTFIGLSQIVSPKGKILVRASEDKEELFTTEIDPSLAKEKSINPFNNLFKDRRPELYNCD